jgi:hypothetical protein
MKWGIRRYQNKDGTLTAEGRKHYGSNSSIYSKGSKFYRISTQKEESEKNNYKYVSKLETDRNYYKGIYAQDIMFDPKKYTRESYAKAKLKDVVDDYKKSGYNLYELTYEAKRDIVSPNKKTRVKVFSEMIENDPTLVKKIHDDLIKDKFFGKNPEQREEINKVLTITKDVKLSDIQKDKRAFQLFSASLNNSDEIRNKYFDILKGYGLNAIVDDNDAGEITRKPMIIIEPADVIQLVEAKELMAKDIAEAYNKKSKDWKKQGIDLGRIEEDEWR